MADAALFDQRDFEAVFRNAAVCVLCGIKAVDPHHILGRGHKYGASPKRRDKRRVFSSIFNCSPLCRECHDIGSIHSDEMQEKLLITTLALASRTPYKWKDKDYAFVGRFKEFYGEDYGRVLARANDSPCKVHIPCSQFK